MKATEVQLKYWWCKLNCWEWPDDLDMPKPAACTRADPNYMAAWDKVNSLLYQRRISHRKVLAFWQNTFLPAREKAKP